MSVSTGTQNMKEEQEIKITKSKRVKQCIYDTAAFFSYFQSSGGWVKIKLKLPHFHGIRYMCADF